MHTVATTSSEDTGSKTASVALISLFVIAFISSALGGTVSTLMSVYLPVAVADLLGPRNEEALNQISAYISAVFILGWAFGGFFWGLVSDRFGRKPAFLLSTACYALSTFLTGLMPNWEGIVVFRFLTGFGVGGVLVSSFTLMIEVWPIRARSIFVGILSISIPVGIFSAGLINYIVGNWRQGFFVGLIPLVVCLPGIWLIKESGSWITEKSKRSNSATALNLLFHRDHRRELWTGSFIFGSMLIGLWAVFSWLPTWVQSLIVAGNGQQERGLSMMLMGMGGLGGGFLSGWVANAIGIRKSMIACFAVSAVFSFILFKTNSVFSPIIYVEIAILALFFGISQGVLSVYIPELFSTNIRASATGFCFNIGRLFTAMAVLFVGVLVTSLGGLGNAIFIFSLVFIVGLAIIVFVKEHNAESYAHSSGSINDDERGKME